MQWIFIPLAFLAVNFWFTWISELAALFYYILFICVFPLFYGSYFSEAGLFQVVTLMGLSWLRLLAKSLKKMRAKESETFALNLLDIVAPFDRAEYQTPISHQERISILINNVAWVITCVISLDFFVFALRQYGMWYDGNFKYFILILIVYSAEMLIHRVFDILFALILKRKENFPHFDHPFLSTSLSEFWGKRWNMTHGNLFRNICYEKLGIFGVFSLSGIYHWMIFVITYYSTNAEKVKTSSTIAFYFVFQAFGLYTERKFFSKKPSDNILKAAMRYLLLLTSVLAPLPLFADPIFEVFRDVHPYFFGAP